MCARRRRHRASGCGRPPGGSKSKATPITWTASTNGLGNKARPDLSLNSSVVSVGSAFIFRKFDTYCFDKNFPIKVKSVQFAEGILVLFRMSVFPFSNLYIRVYNE